MGIDIVKSLKVATIPIVILIVLGILQNVLAAIPFLGFLACLTGVPIFLATLVVLAWAGYKAAKEAQMDIVGGAVTGGLAGLISRVVTGVIGFVLSMLGIGAGMALGGGNGFGAAVGIGFVLVGLTIGIALSTVIGIVMGAIGAFVAGMKK